MRHLLRIAALMLLASCATAYRSGGNGGGFSETKLSPTQWQIGFEGNKKVRQNRAAQFLLRRGAEITLEHHRRFFAFTPLAQSTSGGRGRRYANGQAQLRLLADSTAPDAVDAVVVVQQTDKIAKGRLSEAARATLARIRTP